MKANQQLYIAAQDKLDAMRKRLIRTRVQGKRERLVKQIEKQMDMVEFQGRRQHARLSAVKKMK